MDAAIAGLLGTLVGAAISGGVAFGTDGLRARRERNIRWLTERRAVYVRMIRLTRDQIRVRGSFDDGTPEEETERVRAELSRIDLEIADVAEDLVLLGSDEAVKALMDQQDFDIDGREADRRWVHLRELARKDLLS